MKQKLVIGPISKGLRNDVTPFNIDNDSFPTLINAYQWRKRIRRKRGTTLLGRLTRYFDSISVAYNPGTTTITMVAGTGNLLTGFTGSQIQLSSSIVPGSVTINNQTVPQSYTDPGSAGILVGSIGGTGTINYATGDFTIAGGAANIVNASFKYYPNLPVLGLEPFVSDPSDNPKELGFDTTYSYNISPDQPSIIHSVSFYYNPTASTKAVATPALWSLAEYQQIWTTNYQGALWAVPGIESPFLEVSTKVGMNFKKLTSATQFSATDVDFVTTNNHPFVAGDRIFVNEITTITGLNYMTGVVLAAPPITATTFRATFTGANIGAGISATGIVQALTTSCDATTSSTTPTYNKTSIRWYNGAPVSSSNVFSKDAGWVNFSPPLTTNNFQGFYIADLKPGQYYLVGARMVVPFKDRLLFFGPVVQDSSENPKYLQDTVIYSQNGTPYYTTTFQYAGATEYPTISELVSKSFTSVLVPTNQTAQPQSFFENATGFGGFISAGYARPIISVSPNEDALIVGFSDRQTRLLYTGNDSLPFNFYIINSELGSDSTFSTITLDRGVISVGGRGIILTTQISSQRIDLEIINQVFNIKLTDSGSRRICSQRDFINEWIYITYPSAQFGYAFPTQTLQYNYREDTWALFNECYTTYGTIRFQTGYTWASLPFSSWTGWNDPWESGSITLLQPQVIAGNQQGFILTRGQGTAGEGTSLYIKSITFTTVCTIGSPDHCLNIGDYIIFSGILGTVGSSLNNKVFRVNRIVDDDNFTISSNPGSGTYTGGGLIKRCYIPYIQTKQFPVSWEYGKKTRIGDQRYLLSKTSSGIITLYIFLSQDASTPYNKGPVVPDSSSTNNALIYETELSTHPETYTQQANNASLGSIGDGSATSYTLNYFSIFGIDGSIVAGSVSISVGSVATFTDLGNGTMSVTGTGASGTISYTSGVIVLNFTVAPLNQASSTTFQSYYPDIQNPTSASQDQIWHRVSTSLIGDTVQLGFTINHDQMSDSTLQNQFSEVEIHSIVIDISPAGDLA